MGYSPDVLSREFLHKDSHSKPYKLFDSRDNYRLISAEHTNRLFGTGDIYIPFCTGDN